MGAPAAGADAGDAQRPGSVGSTHEPQAIPSIFVQVGDIPGGAGFWWTRIQRLSDALRRSRDAHADITASRDAAIYDANRAGLSLAGLGKASGLSRTRIQGILADQAIARQDADIDDGGDTDIENPGDR